MNWVWLSLAETTGHLGLIFKSKGLDRSKGKSEEFIKNLGFCDLSKMQYKILNLFNDFMMSLAETTKLWAFSLNQKDWINITLTSVLDIHCWKIIACIYGKHRPKWPWLGPMGGKASTLVFGPKLPYIKSGFSKNHFYCSQQRFFFYCSHLEVWVIEETLGPLCFNIKFSKKWSEGLSPKTNLGRIFKYWD